MSPSAKTIRQILNALAAAERKSNDEKEVIYDREIARFNQIDRDGIIDAVTEAIGDDLKRKKVSASLFAELYDHRA